MKKLGIVSFAYKNGKGKVYVYNDFCVASDYTEMQELIDYLTKQFDEGDLKIVSGTLVSWVPDEMIEEIYLQDTSLIMSYIEQFLVDYKEEAYRPSLDGFIDYVHKKILEQQ